jgi:hypothetical protein
MDRLRTKSVTIKQLIGGKATEVPISGDDISEPKLHACRN